MSGYNTGTTGASGVHNTAGGYGTGPTAPAGGGMGAGVGAALGTALGVAAEQYVASKTGGAYTTGAQSAVYQHPVTGAVVAVPPATLGMGSSSFPLILLAVGIGLAMLMSGKKSS